jgi:hypothetical protein
VADAASVLDEASGVPVMPEEDPRNIMKIRPHHISGILLIVVFLGSTTAAAAKTPALTNITVSNTNDDLLLHLNLEDSFSEVVLQNVRDGKTTSFAFRIQLSRVRDFWLDQKITDMTVIHTIKFDSVKKEYTVRRSWTGYEAETTPSFEEAQRWMNQIEGIKIIALSHIQKGTRYELQAKAEMSKKTLPLNLHHVLFFVSFWDEQTDWYIIEFVY